MDMKNVGLLSKALLVATSASIHPGVSKLVAVSGICDDVGAESCADAARVASARHHSEAASTLAIVRHLRRQRTAVTVAIAIEFERDYCSFWWWGSRVTVAVLGAAGGVGGARWRACMLDSVRGPCNPGTQMLRSSFPLLKELET